VGTLLKPLMDLRAGNGLEGIARGIAFHIVEGLGVVERTRIVEEVKGLDQTARAALRTLGVRFGAYHLFVPAVMKPKPRELAAQLWALRHGGLSPDALQDLSHLALAGRTSIPVNKELPKPAYRVLGYRVLGDRAVRIDILERLADLIRPLIAFKPGITPGLPPKGAGEGDGFTVTVEMTSLAGCSGEDFASILKGLGYRCDTKSLSDLEAVLAVATAKAQAEAAASVVVEAAADGEEAVVETAGEAPAEVVTEATVASETPVAEIAAEETAAVEAEAVAPAAPATIEVWRAVRFERREHSRPPRRERRDGAASGEQAKPAGEGAAQESKPQDGRAPENKRFDRPRRDGEGRPDRSRRDGAPAQDRGPREDRPQRSDRPQREGRPEGERSRSAGKPPRREHGGDRGPRTFSSEAPRKEKAIDLDSPFAKLMALKAQLEGKKD
jgi:ATP-dependent RNA helicase SUPV3L1/SUV3